MTAKDKIIQFHYTHSWPSGKTVYYEFEDAIVVFSIPANCMICRWFGADKNRVWELTRLWAPDGHRKNLLTQAISFAVSEFKKLNAADVIISYADPNVGHSGGVYKAASWVPLGQSEETRAYRGINGEIVSRRKFHSGRKSMRKSEILALGYHELKLPGKLRFAKGISRKGKKLVDNRVSFA